MDLLTGASGFVGGHLLDALAARGRSVRCLVRAPPPGLSGRAADMLVGDLRDAGTWRRALEGVERVYHVAGGGRVSAMSDHGLEVLRDANVAPVAALIEAAHGRALERVVVFSSISAMGVQVGARLDEQSPCFAVTPHEVVKVEAEALLERAYRESALPAVVLRPSQIYGPGDRKSEIPRLVRLAARGLVPLFGGGRGRVPWVHIDDVVQASLRAGEVPGIEGRTYIVSDREPYEFREVVDAIARALGRRRGGVVVPRPAAELAVGLVERLARALGKEPPFTRHRLDSLCGARSLSIARAERELGYAPQVRLADGIAGTVRWLREQGLVS